MEEEGGKSWETGGNRKRRRRRSSEEVITKWPGVLSRKAAVTLSCVFFFSPQRSLTERQSHHITYTPLLLVHLYLHPWLCWRMYSVRPTHSLTHAPTQPCLWGMVVKVMRNGLINLSIIAVETPEEYQLQPITASHFALLCCKNLCPVCVSKDVLL